MENKNIKKYPEYEPIPFWFYNDNYNEDEIIRQLDCMAENGIKAFFLHVRDGKTIEEAYGTDLYFKQVRFIVEQSIKRDIKVWLYDEDSYPSGNCGGKIIYNHPELMSYTLKVEKVEVEDGVARKELGNVKGLYGYVITQENGEEKVEVLKNCFGPIRKNWYHVVEDRAYYYDMNDISYKHYRGETNYAKMSFETDAPENAEVYVAYLVPAYTDERYGMQVDSLNKKTAQVFIEYVHENYKKHVGEYFGKEIPGIFFDEPWTGGYYIPYTDELNGYFYKKYGYRLEDNLYRFCKEYKGEYQAFSRDYLIACSNLFSKNFIAPIKKWCKKNGLLLTGHFTCEENVLAQTRMGQNIFENIKHMDVPGFDIICTNLGDLVHPALILGSNVVSSCSAQNGKNTILAECMALAPFNLNYYGEKRIADWLFVNGINMLVPHALYYGFSAFQHTEAGKSFFFQDAYFEDYVKFTHYVGRVCKLLREYKRDNKVLLILPNFALSGNALRGDLADKEGVLYKIDQMISDFVREAVSKQVGFDTLYATHFNADCIKDGRLKIGKCAYDKVFVVSGGEEENNIYKTLKDGVVDCELVEYGKAVNLEKQALIEGDSKNVLLYKKTNGNKKLYFTFNNSSEYLRLKVKVRENAYVYDAETDQKLSLNIIDGYSEIALQPFDSIIVIEENKKVKTEGEYRISAPENDRHDYLKNPMMYYLPKQARYAITKLNLDIEKDGKVENYTDLNYCRVRDVCGTNHVLYRDKYVVPYYDQAKRFDDIYPVKAVYSAEVEMRDGEYLLFDGGTFSGEYKIYWNGEFVQNNELVNKRVYDVSNVVYYPNRIKDKNLLEIVFDSADEFSGVNGEIYVCDKE